MSAKTTKHILAALIAICMILPVARGVYAQPHHEDEVKAAFLYNFFRFIDWPAAAPEREYQPIILGILGQAPFEQEIRALQDMSVRGRPLKVESFSGAPGMPAPQILFIGQTETDRLDQILSTLEGRPILTVGDMQDFATRGGMIGFVHVKGKIRFEINLTAARRAGLMISSQLLKLASIVGESQQEKRP